LTPLTEEATTAPATAQSGKESEQTEFHIDSDRAADWLLRKLANIDAEQKRVQAQAARIVAELQSDADNLRRLYEGELVNYARQRLAEAGRGRRTLHLLQGSVALRFVPASVRLSDPFAALDYARQAAPALVRTQVSIDAAGYRDQAAKHWKETGELLPGCETTPEHETHRLTFGDK
jgi:phage host-nuclease inhibitor protein Gam